MKKLTNADYKQIILRRDPRYDGRLYFGVTTTKIYCRPVCPARPKFENIVVYKSPSEAEKNGCRACLRCRPDLAPGNKFINPGGNLAAQGLRLIEETAGDDQHIDSLAEKLGISGRHLRRVFDEQLGASPLEIIQSRKLHLAKQLILETRKPITEIAFASGFSSVRRFNEAFRKCYRTTPTQMRAARGCKKSDDVGITLSIPIRKPYNFSNVLSFLKRHAAKGIEEVSDNYYIRFIPARQSYSTIKVTRNKKEDALQVSMKCVDLKQVYPLLLKIRRLFDVDHNPIHLPDAINIRQSGVRVPGCFDPFEVAVSIILSQLISIKQATQKLSDLIQQFGSTIDESRSIYRFPAPANLVSAEIEQIGITKVKAGAIRALAAMVINNELSFTYSADLQITRTRLLSIKGIGPWTTEMIMMRCFGDADAFPENDLFIKRALDSNLVDEKIWKTNRSYMTHFIWNEFGETLSQR